MIYIVIPSLNELSFIKRLLNDFKNQTYTSFQIIISDNGSTDGTKDYIKKKHPQVKLIENNLSFWWTKSTNAGVKYALAKSNSSKDFILTLNNDLTIDNDYLESLITCHNLNKYSIIGSLNVDKISEKIVFGGVKINHFTAKENRINYGKIFSKQSKYDNIESDVLPGRGTLVPIQVFKEIGLYDESLPHYHADYEFSIRAKNNNFNLLVCYQSPVFFYRNNSSAYSGVNKITFNQFFRSLFILKSPNNLFIRGKFIFKTVPFQYLFFYLFFDFARTIYRAFTKIF